MFLRLGIQDCSSLVRKPWSRIAGTNSAVGAATSHWPFAPPWSLAIISSFEA